MKIIQTVGVTAMTSVTQYFTKVDTGRGNLPSLDNDWDQPIIERLFSLNEAFMTEDDERPDKA